MSLVTGPERVSRFLSHSNRFSREKRIVKPNAFIPAEDLMVSVCVCAGREDEKLWNIAEEFLGLGRLKQPGVSTLYGRADFLASAISRVSAKLYLDRDDAPFDGHANIKGWPNDKGEQREIAMLLSKESTLILLGDQAGNT